MKIKKAIKGKGAIIKGMFVKKETKYGEKVIRIYSDGIMIDEFFYEFYAKEDVKDYLKHYYKIDLDKKVKKAK